MRYTRAAKASSPRLRLLVPTIMMLVLCLYFSFYLLFGPRGYFALQNVNATVVQKQAQYDTLKTQRDHLEGDVKLMRPKSLDPDMAEEQARKQLGYMKPNEVVIDLN